MRKLSLLTISVAAALALLDLSLIAAVGNLRALDGVSSSTYQALLKGHFQVLLIIIPLWQWLPGVPSPGALVEFGALAMMAALLGSTYFLLRIRLGKSYLVVAWVSALAWLVPYALGLVALRGNQDPKECGPWIATVLVSVLYSMLACSALALTHYRLASRQVEGARPAVSQRIIELPL